MDPNQYREEEDVFIDPEDLDMGAEPEEDVREPDSLDAV